MTSASPFSDPENAKYAPDFATPRDPRAKPFSGTENGPDFVPKSAPPRQRHTS